MNKLTKSIVTLGLLITLATPTLATELPKVTVAEQLKSNGYQYNEVMKVLKDGITDLEANKEMEIEVSDRKKYNAVFKVVDKYGNLLVGESKYNGDFTVEQPVKYEFSDKELNNYMFSITRPYYYKPIKQSYTVNKPNQEILFTFVPTKVVNTVQGKVKFPEGTDLTNAWIQVKGSGDKIQDAVLKVNKDGTFKIENIMDGTYTFTPFVGELSYHRNKDYFNYKTKFNQIEVVIKGNTTVNFDAIVSTPNDTTDKQPKRQWLFEQADYSDKSRFTEISPMLELPQELKDITDKLYSDDLLTFLKNIFEYKEANFNRGSGLTTVTDRTTKELFSSKYLDNCGDHAILVNSMLRYKGIPTVMVTAARVNEYDKNVSQGHEYLEIYSSKEDKWILIDTTVNTVTLDYDINNPFTEIIGSIRNMVIFEKYITPEDALPHNKMSLISHLINELAHNLRLNPLRDSINQQSNLN